MFLFGEGEIFASHIGEIQQVSELSGQVFRKTETGEKVILNPSLRLSKEQFSILYFEELPESLAPRRSSEGLTPSLPIETSH